MEMRTKEISGIHRFEVQAVALAGFVILVGWTQKQVKAIHFRLSDGCPSLFFTSTTHASLALLAHSFVRSFEIRA